MDRSIGPLQDTITWYKIRHTGTQTAHWDIPNKEDLSLSHLSHFILDVPVRSLCSRMADFVPCDGILQRAYCLSVRLFVCLPICLIHQLN